MSGAEIVQRRGGWFVTGVEWSGPWASHLAAEYARDGEYSRAHGEERRLRNRPAATLPTEKEKT